MSLVRIKTLCISNYECKYKYHYIRNQEVHVEREAFVLEEEREGGGGKGKVIRKSFLSETLDPPL